MHAEYAYLVARRRDDSAPAIPADDQRATGERELVMLLHGGVERIHVDVQDGARHGSLARVATAAR